jgi:nitrogen-specific signal transduction histidine kinase
MVRRDGREVPCSKVLVAHRAPSGEVEFFSVIAHDMTERRSLEEQIRQAQKMEAVGRLAGGVAHDFNNLLTAISGYSDFLLRRLGPQHPLRKDAEEIQRAAARAASLTRQLLAFSRRQVLEPKVIDLNLVVTDMEKMLRRLIGEHIELATSLDPALGRVRADRGQIEQVLLNLAVNARDAMPGGGRVTIETRNVDLDAAYARDHVGIEPGAYVLLCVSDTGVGMDDETRLHIFEPFFTTKAGGSGTGLGLSTVYGIVRQSGGSIEVASEPGRGAAFKVYLPRVEGTAAPLAAPKPAGPDLAAGTGTVLVVEDEEIVRSLARRILETAGYRVLEAADPHTALEICDRFAGPIDLLLTDIVMPKMSGRVLAERVAERRPEVRTLFMSAYAEAAVAREAGGEDLAWIEKPFTVDMLTRKVQEVLALAKQR